ncbi:MAG: hypothetical protein MRY83_08325, partial [Flavobacteriales bacterium]|nr:hypothetical protein [Flavobacteriales bacterium]
IETLEPQAHDSYFNWNFFDYCLQQKEWFSPFSFEPLAEGLLLEKPLLRTEFETKKNTDPEFAVSRKRQLRFIYERSQFYEDTHLQYPVYRLK